MNKQQLWAKVNTENNGQLAEFLFYLYSRWQDEKDFEDINEYLTAFQARVPGAFKISKRPFGVTCKCDDGNLLICIKKEGRYLKIYGKSV